VYELKDEAATSISIGKAETSAAISFEKVQAFYFNGCVESIALTNSSPPLIAASVRGDNYLHLVNWRLRQLPLFLCK
jgi:hypothetical protein